MSHLVLVEQVFTTQEQAESYLEALRPTAWPYAWCTHDTRNQGWKVTALVEEVQLRKVS